MHTTVRRFLSYREKEDILSSLKGRFREEEDDRLVFLDDDGEEELDFTDDGDEDDEDDEGFVRGTN